MRITTRCLACLLCALLALSPVALAEAPAEAMGAYFKLSDLQLDVDGVTADLSGLGMEIGAVIDEELALYATSEAGTLRFPSWVRLAKREFPLPWTGFPTGMCSRWRR